MIKILGLFFTIIIFKLSENLKTTPVIGRIPPVMITGIVIILFLEVFNVDFYKYNESACFLTYLLAPATIALGYPLYKNYRILLKNKRIIFSAFLFATLCAVMSTYLIAKLCGVKSDLILSMIPKSVTAPIAVEISKISGGIPELTACVVVLTGVCGALIGHKLLEIAKVKNDIAIGIAMGATSHVIATSRCIEKGRPKQVVMGTIALVTVGIITSILVPVVVLMIK